MFIKREDAENMISSAQIISDGEYCGYCTEDINIDKLPSITKVPDKITDMQEIKNALHLIAYLQNVIGNLYFAISDNNAFAEIYSWEVSRLHENCRIIEGDLYSDKTFLCGKDNCVITDFGNAYKKITYTDTETDTVYGAIFIEIKPDTYVEISCEA